MIFYLNPHNRIVTNPCGGFDWQAADIDKKTGLIRTHSKTGAECWPFHEFHPKLENLLISYVMQTAAVMDETLTDAYKIAATITTECAAIKAMYSEFGKELDAVTKERDRLAAQLKAKKEATND